MWQRPGRQWPQWRLAGSQQQLGCRQWLARQCTTLGARRRTLVPGVAPYEAGAGGLPKEDGGRGRRRKPEHEARRRGADLAASRLEEDEGVRLWAPVQEQDTRSWRRCAARTRPHAEYVRRLEHPSHPWYRRPNPRRGHRGAREEERGGAQGRVEWRLFSRAASGRGRIRGKYP